MSVDLELGCPREDSPLTSVKQDSIAQAVALKDAGNALFQKNSWEAAIAKYTAGLTIALAADQRDLQVMILCNRALCYIRSEQYGAAVADAAAAIVASGNKSAKAFFRRGTAHFCLAKYDLAVQDFRQANRIEPQDKLGVARLTEAKRLLHEKRFADAIRSERATPLSQRINLSLYKTPDSYKGPRLEKMIEDDFTELIEYFSKDHHNRLDGGVILRLALKIIEANRTLPNIVNISVPKDTRINICGDIHGQFYDLLNIFKLHGLPSTHNKYVFNGDFVDRGSFSVEVITTLYLARLIWPDSVFMTRGNHESRALTRLYGFEGEMQAKGSDTLYNIYAESFETLPLVHLIEGRVFVVHGGLPIQSTTLAQINAIDRFSDDGDDLMTDLLWADPQVMPGNMPSKRGVSQTFGPDITSRFLKDNSLELIIRSHEVKEQGYDLEHNGQLITVFSAPNYCDQVGNLGAIVRFTADKLHDRSAPLDPEFLQFAAVPHPPVHAMSYANRFLSMG